MLGRHAREHRRVPELLGLTLVVSPYTAPTVSTNAYNHYNLLQATEAMLRLPLPRNSNMTGGSTTPNDPRIAFNLR